MLTKMNHYVLHKFKGANATQQEKMVGTLKEQMENLNELLTEMEKVKKYD